MKKKIKIVPKCTTYGFCQHFNILEYILVIILPPYVSVSVSLCFCVCALLFLFKVLIRIY